MPQVAENARRRSFIGTTLPYCPRNDEENVEKGAERCDAKGNRCYDDIDSPKIKRQSATEEHQRGLQHQRQQLHDAVKVPRDDSVLFSLPALATVNTRPSHVDRLVTAQPLLAEHCQEGGEE